MTSIGVARPKQLRDPGYRQEIGRGCSHQNIHAYMQIYKFAVNICHKYRRIIRYMYFMYLDYFNGKSLSQVSGNCNTNSSTLSSKFFFPLKRHKCKGRRRPFDFTVLSQVFSRLKAEKDLSAVAEVTGMVRKILNSGKTAGN